MSKVFDAYAANYDLLYMDTDYASEEEYCRELWAEQGLMVELFLNSAAARESTPKSLLRMVSVHGIDLSATMVDAAEVSKSTNFVDRLHFEMAGCGGMSQDLVFLRYIV